MIRLLSASVALAATTLVAQSPLETTFTTPVAPNTYVTATPSPITGLFDMTISAPTGVVLNQIELQMNTLHGVNGQFGLWMTAAGDTHVGNSTNASVWSQMSSAATTHTGGRVTFVLNPPVALAAGTYGVAFHCIEANPLYHSGTNSSTVLPQTYATNEMSVDLSAARMRASDPVDPFGGGSAGFSPRQMAMALHYTVGATSVDFTATPTAGPSPLTVQFTSLAVSGAPGGVLNYLWDFDNDGVIDDTTPNPTHVYTSCGSFTPSLTIVDALGTTTETKVDYVVTDVLTPSFSNQLLAPLTVQFTDTTTPTPTSWAWDFNNDGVVDDTSPNPIWVFSAACAEETVSLTVSRNCQGPYTSTRRIGVGSSIQTTFQGGLVTNTTFTSSSNFFDVNVTNPKGVTICGIHVNQGLAAGAPFTVNLYQTEGSYVGKTKDASQWRLVASEAALSAPGQLFIPLSTPLHLAQGQFGICMQHDGRSPSYTNIGTSLTVSTPDLTLTAGLTQGEPLFDAAAAEWSPRIGNIALHYSTTSSNGAAGYGFVGAGCVGSLGVPGNVSTTQPVLGGAATIVVDKLPLDIGALALGLGRNVPPLDLAIIGMPGCPLHTSADAVLTIAGTGNTATFVFPVPVNAALVGAQFYSQVASLDLGINPLGFALSDAAVMLVGQ